MDEYQPESSESVDEEGPDPDEADDFDPDEVRDPDSHEHEVARVYGAAEVDFVCLTCGAQGLGNGHLDAQSWHDAR